MLSVNEPLHNVRLCDTKAPYDFVLYKENLIMHMNQKLCFSVRIVLYEKFVIIHINQKVL